MQMKRHIQTFKIKYKSVYTVSLEERSCVAVKQACSVSLIPRAGHIVTEGICLQLHLGQMSSLSKGKCTPTISIELHSSSVSC